jgi:hypothetical protein
MGGQIDRPAEGGQQPHDKGIGKAARELPVPGKSEEGRRKFVERALQVAAISAEAKEAAISAGLDKNRSALLEIARGQSPQAQLDLLARFVERKSRKSFMKSLRQANSNSVPARATFDVGAHQEADVGGIFASSSTA